jgi:NADH dehydrogenase (ubiquinone) 1 alpha subcomplex subunit 9
LHIFEGDRHSVSGVRATIFGATGFIGNLKKIGPYAGAILGYIGSDLIFPHNHEYIYDDDVKELRLCAGTGYAQLGTLFFNS